ncbi:MAG: MFS transporter [Chloroflexi bacterium]|nr:MFS transporter [Chloroflexota bacterium]
MASLPVFRAARYRSFRWFWASSLFWSANRWIETVALGWLVLELTNSAVMVGLAAALSRGFPFLIFAAVGGMLADRRDRRQLLVWGQIGVGLLSLLMAVLIFAGTVQVWQIMAITALAGTMMALTVPSHQSLTRDLVEKEDLLNAVSLNTLAVQATRIVAPALAGGLIKWGGVGACYSLIGINSLLSIALLLRVPGKLRGSPKALESAWRNLASGLRYVRSNGNVRALLLVEIVCDAFGFSYYAMMPLFARDVLHVGPSGLGFLLTATGAGAIIGLLAVASLGDIRGKGRLLLIFALAFGLALMAFSFSQWYLLSLLVLVIVGGVSGAYDALMSTVLQSIVPDQVRGRVMGAYILTWGTGPLGGLQAGALAGVWGAPFAVALGGGLVALYILGLVGKGSAIWKLG